MEKSCRNCKNYRYGKCEILSDLLSITVYGTKTVVCEECGEETDVDLCDYELDEINITILNPTKFSCNKWE